MQFSTAWNLLLDSSASRTLFCPQLTILLASVWLSNQVSGFFYQREVRALGLPVGEASEPKIASRQPEQLPYDFSPQGPAFDDNNIPSEVLLSDFGQSPSQFHDQNEIEPEKRGDKLLPVAFPCGRQTALCRNHGRGPKVTMSRKRRGAAMCVCLCPPGYTRPQCARNNKPVR